MKKVLFREADRPAATDDTTSGADPISITAAAAREVQNQARRRGTPDAAIRLGVRGGGCTGFTYVFDFVEGEPKPNDKVFSGHGVSVYVNPKSFKLLRGTELDFVRSLSGHGFKFKNPNAKSTCGCGESVEF